MVSYLVTEETTEIEGISRHDTSSMAPDKRLKCLRREQMSIKNIQRTSCKRSRPRIRGFWVSLIRSLPSKFVSLSLPSKASLVFLLHDCPDQLVSRVRRREGTTRAKCVQREYERERERLNRRQQEGRERKWREKRDFEKKEGHIYRDRGWRWPDRSCKLKQRQRRNMNELQWKLRRRRMSKKRDRSEDREGSERDWKKRKGHVLQRIWNVVWKTAKKSTRKGMGRSEGERRATRGRIKREGEPPPGAKPGAGNKGKEEVCLSLRLKRVFRSKLTSCSRESFFPFFFFF